MTVSIGQVSYSLYPPQADPGMLADNEVNHILSVQAAETVHPGRVLQLAADNVSCQEVQNTSTGLGTVLGLAVLLTAREGTGNSNTGSASGGAYNAGDMVAVLRRGAMFAEWKGTTQTAYAMPNVYHSSTIAVDRGKLTDAATSTSAGVEVANAGNFLKLRQALTGSGSIALVEVNLPGAA